MGGAVSLLLNVLLWASVAEFALLRTFLRLGPVLPVREPLLPAYRAVELVGLAAMNLALLTAAALVVVLAAGSPARAASPGWGRRMARSALAGLVVAAVLANLALGAMPAAGPVMAATAVQASLTGLALLAALGGSAFAGTVAVAGAVAAAPPGRRYVPQRRGVGGRLGTPGRLALVLIVGAQLLALFHSLAQAASGWGRSLPGRSDALLVAEAMAVAAALALPWSYRPLWRRRHLVLGAALGTGLLAALAIRPWVIATVSMWTVSLSLFLPGVLYAAALGSVAATLWALFDAGGAQRTAASGLLLVGLAGLKLDFTYFALLALAGVLVLRRSPCQVGRVAAPPLTPG